MGHRVTIGGTGHDIAGGKTLVSGTARTLSGGRTRVAGTIYDIPLDRFDPVLNNNTWEQISLAAQKGVAENVWRVGDTKEITLSGSVGGVNLSGTYLCYILGFNHNAALEGDNRIHFQLARSTAGKELCFYRYQLSSAFGTAGGWEKCSLRNTLLGTDPANCAGTILGTFPAELLAVLRPAQKYSDNGSGDLGSVSATTDYLWIPAEKEVFGTVTEGTAGQGQQQAQYAYYAAGGSKIRYAQNDTRNTEREWWLRSRADAFTFCYVDDTGNVMNEVPSEEYGVAPIFCV